MAFLVSKPQAPARRFFAARSDPLLGLVGAALLVGTPLHFIGLDRALWLDETWTGAIAAQPTLGAVFHQILFDVNAPLYYLLAHYWAMVFGLSNVALRMPSALLAAAAALVAAASRAPIARETKLTWAALLALWVPGLDYAQDARCYALLFFLATINTLLFARLVADPKRSTAFFWAAAGLLLILTHYHALLLVVTQAIVLLAWHRRKALDLWPALLVFAPFPAWMALHLGVILRFLDPNATWYWLLTLHDLPEVLAFLFNSSFVAALSLLFLILCLRAGDPGFEAIGRKFNALWLVALAALVPAVVVVAIGFVRPSFSERYLIAFGPGILLGLALLAGEARRHWALAPHALLLMFFMGTATWLVKQIGAPANPYNFEYASRSLMQAGADRLVFLWDNPNSKVIDPQQLSAVGGFFFKRAGVPIDVTPIKLQNGEDPNIRLVEAAAPHRASILWLYDVDVAGTAARVHPLAITAHDPSWFCRNFGDRRFGVVACDRKADRHD